MDVVSKGLNDSINQTYGLYLIFETVHINRDDPAIWRYGSGVQTNIDISDCIPIWWGELLPSIEMNKEKHKSGSLFSL